MKKWMAGITLAVGLLGFGCREEGAAERAGRQIDEAVGTAREEAEDSLERLGRSVDEVVEKTEEAAEEIAEEVEKAVDKVLE